jgi:hypothetical protein
LKFYGGGIKNISKQHVVKGEETYRDRTRGKRSSKPFFDCGGQGCRIIQAKIAVEEDDGMKPNMAVLLEIILVLGLSASMATTSPAWAADTLKVPQVNIIQPAANIPDDVKAFSGKWKGRWGSWQCPAEHGLDAILTIEEISSPNEANGHYSWGNDVGWNIEPGYAPIKAKIEKRDGKVFLEWQTKQGSTFSFYLENGKLKGQKGGQRSPYKVTMEKF